MKASLGRVNVAQAVASLPGYPNGCARHSCKFGLVQLMRQPQSNEPRHGSERTALPGGSQPLPARSSAPGALRSRPGPPSFEAGRQARARRRAGWGMRRARRRRLPTATPRWRPRARACAASAGPMATAAPWCSARCGPGRTRRAGAREVGLAAVTLRRRVGRACLGPAVGRAAGRGCTCRSLRGPEAGGALQAARRPRPAAALQAA